MLDFTLPPMDTDARLTRWMTTLIFLLYFVCFDSVDSIVVYLKFSRMRYRVTDGVRLPVVVLGCCGSVSG